MADNPQAGSRYTREVNEMLKASETATGPAKAAVDEWLVRRAKDLPGWNRPVEVWSKTNVKWARVLVSYHHPAQLCWSWMIWLSFNRHDCRWRHPKRWFAPFRFGQMSLTVPFLFRLSYHRQSYDWMLSSLAKQRLHHFANKDTNHDR